MEYKHLGKTGLKVSRLAIGCAGWGLKVNEADSIALIKNAIAEGMTFIDAADIYGKNTFLTPNRGPAEVIVGKAIKGMRHSVVLATKVGGRVGPTQNDIGLNRLHIIEAVEEQLRRLQTDYIDLYYAHIFDYTTPLEETLRAMDDLVRQGKVRYVGCSNYYAWQLCKALWLSERYNLVHYDCIESSYNLLARDIERELLPLCDSEGIGVNVWAPQAGGLLTGKYTFSPNEPPPERKGYGMWGKTIFEAISHMQKAAEASGHTLTQLSLGWLLNNPTITSVIIGFSSLKQLKDNLTAVGVQLTAEEKAACSEAEKILSPAPKMFLPTCVEGERRPIDSEGNFL